MGEGRGKGEGLPCRGEEGKNRTDRVLAPDRVPDIRNKHVTPPMSTLTKTNPGEG